MVQGLRGRALERALVEHLRLARRVAPLHAKASAGAEPEVLLPAQQLPDHPVDILQGRVGDLTPDGSRGTKVARVDVARPVELRRHGMLNLGTGDAVVLAQLGAFVAVRALVLVAPLDALFEGRNNPAALGDVGTIAVGDARAREDIDNVAAVLHSDDADRVHEGLVLALDESRVLGEGEDARELFTLGVRVAIKLLPVAMEVGRADDGSLVRGDEVLKGIVTLVQVNGAFLLVGLAGGHGHLALGKLDRVEAAGGGQWLAPRNANLGRAWVDTERRSAGCELRGEGKIGDAGEPSLGGLVRVGGHNHRTVGLAAGVDGAGTASLALGSDGCALTLVVIGIGNFHRDSGRRSGVLLFLGDRVAPGRRAVLKALVREQDGHRPRDNGRHDDGRNGRGLVIMEGQPDELRTDPAFLEERIVGSRDPLDLDLDEELAEALVVIQPVAVEQRLVPLQMKRLVSASCS